MEQSQEDYEDELDQEDEESDEIPEFHFENLNEDSDRELVRSGILDKYGFVPPDDYIEDLIIFVTQLTKGSESGS